jgi:hypothetical protein
VHHEQVAAALLLPPHQSTLSLLRRLWPRQLIRWSIRSSPEGAVHLIGSCSSLALLILLRRQPLDRGSSILYPSRLYADNHNFFMLTCSCPALQNWYLSLLACREYYLTLDTPNVWCLYYNGSFCVMIRIEYSQIYVVENQDCHPDHYLRN